MGRRLASVLQLGERLPGVCRDLAPRAELAKADPRGAGEVAGRPLALPMLALYEGSVIAVKMVERRRARAQTAANSAT